VFWPRAGDEGTSIEGVYEELEPGRYGDVLLIRTASGVRKVGGSARVKAVLPRLKLGARYRFTYAGTVTTSGGQTVKEISIDRARDGRDGPAADRDDAPAATAPDAGDADEVPYGAGRATGRQAVRARCVPAPARVKSRKGVDCHFAQVFD
jgi:hypothetical protein